MPLFQVDIEKVLQGEYWTNRYHLQDQDIGQATGVALANLVPAERAITAVAVQFTVMRVRDMVEGTDIYTITPLNLAGLRAGDSSSLIPLFNVVRVDFGALTGRPSRKYLRGILREGDIQFNDIAVTVVGDIQTAYANPLVALDQFRDVDNDAIVSGSVKNQVGMRQLRRGSRRRTEPILNPPPQ